MGLPQFKFVQSLLQAQADILSIETQPEGRELDFSESTEVAGSPYPEPPPTPSSHPGCSTKLYIKS